MTFRKQVRHTWASRTSSYGPSDTHDPEVPDLAHDHERSPLLSLPPITDQRYGFLRCLLDQSSTPGLDSPKRFVKWPAHIIHIIKVTLLHNYVNVLLVFVPLGIAVAGGEAGVPQSSSR
ncbi:hypothetical protein NCS52_01549200 [Fusarium sp. LHS14.1]|nr:hypothetical protein NCS52_01549200 [Fusarium sp. LHS14.1]